ncbi:hypothetical protein N431DRAFT_554254 [Stipitochalara longipes BDJ]|nr:hypothetical protein N431DRAFT_554254 [Stipitochalara longipes BDJ]
MSNHYSRDRSERSGSARPSTNGRSSIGHGGMTPHYRQDDHTGMSGYYQPQPPTAPYDNPYGGGYDPYHPQMVTHAYQAPPPRNRGDSVMTGDGAVPMSAVVPGTAFVNSQQLDVAYAYGIQREDGSYTRLIRADELADMNNVPRGQGPEGLIILPAPRQMDPALRAGPEPMVPREVIQALPGNRPRGFNQTPYSRSNPSDTTQEQIDAIVAAHPVGPVVPVASHPPPARRREKIYCDKWIHEGTCAFTQMGCKYRHEMPMDRETQLSLGLNHGLPNWYRREYGVNMQSPAAPPALLGPPNNRLDGPWRRLEAAQAEPGYTSPGSRLHAPGTSTSSMRPAYGPIAPPPGQAGPSFSNNPFAALKIEERDEEDEDEVTWRGRGGPQGPNNHHPQQ